MAETLYPFLYPCPFLCEFEFPYQEVESISLPIEAELNLGTSFSQWDNSRSDSRRSLRKYLYIFVCALVLCHGRDEERIWVSRCRIKDSLVKSRLPKLS